MIVSTWTRGPKPVPHRRCQGGTLHSLKVSLYPPPPRGAKINHWAASSGVINYPRALLVSFYDSPKWSTCVKITRHKEWTWRLDGETLACGTWLWLPWTNKMILMNKPQNSGNWTGRPVDTHAQHTHTRTSTRGTFPRARTFKFKCSLCALASPLSPLSLLAAASDMVVTRVARCCCLRAESKEQKNNNNKKR